MSIEVFSEGLADTSASLLIQRVSWIVPTVQTIHILSIAAVVGSVLVVHLRNLRVALAGESRAALAQRFLPWIWYAVLVLLVSGAVLITGEPRRSLPNGVFQLKMAMLAVVLVLTALYQRPLRADPGYWERTRVRRAQVFVLACVSLALWMAIVFAGRWIAYAVGA